MLNIKGHFNWVSEVLEIMKDNNIIDPNISNDDINSKLKENYKSDLLKRIHSYARERKKLRMYAEFKHVIKYESYLDTIKNAKYRIMLSKFRLSSHDLEIERGRYGHKSTNPEERHYKFCQSNSDLITEDEFHFLMVCPLYKSKREKLFQNVCEVFPNITQNSSKIQFLWLMSQENEKCMTNIAKFVTQSMTLRTKELDILINLNNTRTIRGKI